MRGWDVRRAALIVNPMAGAGRAVLLVDALWHVFAEHGVSVDWFETTADSDSAHRLAAAAAERCELVIACGGDGTVHGVLQGLAQTGVALGVLPLGTANALARNLRLPLDPVMALGQLLRMQPRAIPLGVAETAAGRRWFTVMAGAGPDGRLVHELEGRRKVRAGRSAYYTAAARLLLSRRFPRFLVEFRLTGSGPWKRREVVAMMASRIPDLGGAFSGLTRGSRLDHSHLLVHMLRAPAQVALAAWVAFGRVGLERRNPFLETVAVEELCCSPTPGAATVLTQVDGEATGALPMRLGIVPDALRLLMP